MARALRINLSDGWYHVTARGNQRQRIFLDEGDRWHFRELLAESVPRFAWRLHAYVLMANHYHLLVQTPQANLSQAMHWLGVSYTVWFNRRHQRVGHLFQGRFKAIVIEAGAALQLSRYVHLNPVRVRGLGLDREARQRQRVGAGGAPDPGQVAERLRQLRAFRWSSYRAQVGLEGAPGWLCSELIRPAGGEAKAAIKAYRAYVEQAVREGLAESPWERLEGGLVLGGAEFVRRVREGLRGRGNRREQPSVRRLEKRPSFEAVVRVVERLKGEGWEQFRDRHGDWGRDVSLWLGRRQAGLSLKALGSAVGGLDYVSVCMAIKRLRRRMAEDRRLAALVRDAETELLNEKT